MQKPNDVYMVTRKTQPIGTKCDTCSNVADSIKMRGASADAIQVKVVKVPTWAQAEVGKKKQNICSKCCYTLVVFYGGVDQDFIERDL